jgi:hypothetical protein
METATPITAPEPANQPPLVDRPAPADPALDPPPPAERQPPRSDDRHSAHANARFWKTIAFRILGWCLVVAIFVLAGALGWRLRHWAFDISDPIRFFDDTARGSMWGLIASGPEGYFNQYDKMEPEVPEWQDPAWTPWLDYAPLRLLVMREWGAWQRKYHPPEPGTLPFDAWQRAYWFNEPVLRFNGTLEAFSAICAFFLTRLWVIRGRGAKPRGHFDGVWQGVVAALLLWFSPDIIVSAHVWFQWDSWAVPWYLCACLLASLDWWFAAGIAVAIGCCFKGQMMSITPIFIIWPLVQGRLGAALRSAIGMVFGMAAIASGWLITYLPPDRLQAARDIQATMAVSQYPFDLFAIPRKFDLPAAIWIAEMLLIAGTLPWLVRILAPAARSPSGPHWRKLLQSPWTWRIVAGACIAISVYWPWLLKVNRSGWMWGVIASASVAAAAMLLPRRGQPFLLAAILAGGLLACMAIFHGSDGWWYCSFKFGSIHWPYMVTGPASNVPAYFQLRFNWPRENAETAFTLPAIAGHWPAFVGKTFGWPATSLDVSAKMLFNAIYGVMLLLSGIAIGLQARRNDRRMLVALVTPWVMFFLFPVQIQERYLLYGAGAAACCIGDSVGAALLGVLLTLFSMTMHVIRLLDWGTADLDGLGQSLSQRYPSLFSPQSGHTMLQYMEPLHPAMMWGVLVIGLILLYQSFRRSPVR